MNREQIHTEKFTAVIVKCLMPRISKENKLKIIAEMNFLPQHKEEWPRYVRAQFALQEFEKYLKKSGDEKDAYKHISYFLGIQPAELKRFREVLKMIDTYVKHAVASKERTRYAAEIFGRSKFQLFEELYNKAKTINKPTRDVFFRLLLKQEITSLTKVREFTKIIAYAPARKHLQKKSGSFELAKSMYNESASPRKALARIKRFCEWLENLPKNERDRISVDHKKRLSKAANKLLNK